MADTTDKPTPTVKIAPLSKFRPQRDNANEHTLRGTAALDASISHDGYLTPMTAATDGEVIEGSNRLERSADIFGPDAEVIEVHHDGTRPIVMVRDDLPSASDPRAKRLSVASNRVAELDLAWNAARLLELNADDPTAFSGLFTPDEANRLLESAQQPYDDTAAQNAPDQPPAEQTISPELFERQDYLVFYFANEFDWQVACEKLGVESVYSAPVGKRTIQHRGLGRLLPASKLLELLK